MHYLSHLAERLLSVTFTFSVRTCATQLLKAAGIGAEVSVVFLRQHSRQISAWYSCHWFGIKKNVVDDCLLKPPIPTSYPTLSTSLPVFLFCFLNENVNVFVWTQPWMCVCFRTLPACGFAFVFTCLGLFFSSEHQFWVCCVYTEFNYCTLCGLFMHVNQLLGDESNVLCDLCFNVCGLFRWSTSSCGCVDSLWGEILMIVDFVNLCVLQECFAHC